MNKLIDLSLCIANTLGMVTFACICLVLPSAVNAQDESLECGNETTSVYFGNGLDTSRAKAELMQAMLEADFKETLEENYPGERFDFKLAYNDADGLSAELTQAFLQTVGRENQQLFASLSGEQLYRLMTLSGQRFNELADLIHMQYGDVITGNALLELLSVGNRDALRQTIEDGVIELLARPEFAEQLLQADTNATLTQLYRSDLDVGQRVVVIAHSQGNVFARDNIAALLASNPEYASSIGSVGVATPLALQPNGGDYLTANDDRVIEALRVSTLADTVVGNEPLAANWDNEPRSASDHRDFLNHGFVRSYFNSALSSKDEIANVLDGLAASLTFPNSVVSTGAIRVTLEWGSEPDLDLHAYEPDGTHVYYSNLIGASGFLDRDDTDSFGPENYFVPCETVQVGSYGFGVNYYAGDEPEVASISLILSDGQTASLEEPLDSGIGVSGNNPPVLLAVSVERDAQGILSYTIEEGLDATELVTPPDLTIELLEPKKP